MSGSKSRHNEDSHDSYDHVEQEERGRSYTVHEAIETIGHGKVQVILGLLAGLCMMADSMEVMLLSVLSPALICEWAITPFEQAMVTTCVFLGWLVAAPAWGVFCDRYGRKKGSLISSALAWFFGTVTALAPSFGFLLFFRCLVGATLAGVTQSGTLYSEFLPVKNRGLLMTSLAIFWSLGAAAEAVLAMLLMESAGWRWLIVISSLPLGIFALSCAWIPESPYFLLSKDRVVEAHAVLQRLANINGKELPSGELASISRSSESIESKPSVLFQFRSLFARAIVRSTLLVSALWALNAFCYYGVTLYTTQLLHTGDNCGGTSTKNSSLSSNSTCNPLGHDDYVDILTTAGSEVPGVLVAMALIELLGRKKTIALQFAIFSTGYFVLYKCWTHTAVICILFVIRAAMAGAFQSVFVYTPEVYPTSLRALGMGVASGLARIGAMASPLVAQVLGQSNLGLAAILYGSASGIAAILSLLLPIETKNRPLAHR